MNTEKCPVCGAKFQAGELICGECGFQPTAEISPPEERTANICTNPICSTINPPGERLCQRCNTPLPGAVGQTIAGKYIIERALAAGGFGIVYLGKTLQNQRIAIKEMISTDPQEFKIRRTFFQREAQILRELQAIPSVPKLYDFVEEGETLYLVLEYIPGKNLLEILEQNQSKPFPLHLVIKWGIVLCQVLEQMHRHNPPLIYRDLKPDNIMLQPDGETIRLIDFGTARQLGASVKERSVAKTKVFTEGYAPPEQVIGKPEPRSDLFALAGTLFHLATGRCPEGFFTQREILANLSGKGETYAPEDRWFFELLAIQLAEDPNDRFFHVKEFCKDLEKKTVTREMVCPQCSNRSPAREPYCVHCAHPQTEKGVPCSQCQCTNRWGCRFCIQCGHRLR